MAAHHGSGVNKHRSDHRKARYKTNLATRSDALEREYSTLLALSEKPCAPAHVLKRLRVVSIKRKKCERLLKG